jgi:hypothetical protein
VDEEGPGTPLALRPRTPPSLGSNSRLAEDLLGRISTAVLDPAAKFGDKARRIVGFHEFLKKLVVGFSGTFDRFQ